MKKESNFPPPDVWDFRGIDDSALADATLYEYARSSPKLRDAIWKCLTTKIKGKQIRQHIVAALIEQRKATKPKSAVASFVGSFMAGEVFHKPFPDCFPDGVWQKAHDGLLKACGGYELAGLIMDDRPDFPNPWLAHPLTYKPNPHFSRLLITPMRMQYDRLKETIATYGMGDAAKVLDNRKTWDNSFKLTVWPWHGSTIEQIVNDFRKWLREESKKHPEMKQRGMKGQTHFAPLAWLAAYRISKAGISFEAAQGELQRRGINHRSAPRYSDKSGWSDAIKKAKAILAEMEN